MNVAGWRSAGRVAWMEWVRRYVWLAGVLGVILVFGGVVRVWGGGGLGESGGLTLWTDEMFSLQSSTGRGFWVEELPRGVVMEPPVDVMGIGEGSGTIGGIYRGQATDTNPFLYYMALRVWREVFGSSAEAVRGLSVAWGLVAVGGLFWAGVGMRREKKGFPWEGILMGAIAALAASQVVYSREARGYEMACGLLCVGAGAVMWIRAKGFRWVWGVTLGACVAGAMMCIYLAALPVAAMGIYAAGELRGRDRWRTLVCGVGGVMLAGVVLTPLLLEQRSWIGMRNQFLVAEEPRTVGWVAKDLAGAVVGQIAPLQERSAGAAYVAVGLLGVGAVPLWMWSRGSRLWLVWVGSVLGALALMDLWGNKTHLGLLRYTMLAGPGVVGVVVSVAGIEWKGMSGGLRRLLWGVPVGVLAYAGVSLPATFSMERSMKEEWGIVTEFARKQARDGDVWVIGALGGRRWDHILYMGLVRSAPGARAVAIVDDEGLEVEGLRAEAERRGGLVIFAEDGTTIEGLVPQGWKRVAFQKFPTVGTLVAWRPGE